VIVTGCMGAEPEKITKRYPAARVNPAKRSEQYEYASSRPASRGSSRHDPFLSRSALLPPEGIKAHARHYAYLRFFKAATTRFTFCIIHRLARDLVSRAAADVLRESERLGRWPAFKDLPGLSQDTPLTRQSTSNMRQSTEGTHGAGEGKKCFFFFAICAARWASSASNPAALRLNIP